MNVLGKIVSSVSSALDFNAATLSGCIDIVVVAQDDGTLASSPFHVRFGKLQLLKSREKLVHISVNGKRADFCMKLGEAGEAFFAHRTDNEPDVSAYPTTQSIEAEANNFMDTEGVLGDAVVEKEATGLVVVDVTKRSIRAAEHSPSRADSGGLRSMDSVSDDACSPVGAAATAMEEDWDWAWGSLPESCTVQRKEPSADVDTLSLVDLKVELSLCGNVMVQPNEDVIQIFEQHRISFEQLCEQPDLIHDPTVVVRIGSRLFPWKIAAPQLMAYLAFNKPLPMTVVRRLLDSLASVTDGLGKATVTAASNGSWRKWFKKPNTSNIEERAAVSPVASGTAASVKAQPSDSSRTLRPTSEQLKSLELHSGKNTIVFTVTSKLQGTQSVSASLYLWSRHSKIVVSDIDGTITRSDVLGQLMPMMGRDWSHLGVASLYSKIVQNGYRILYLTSRAIGQARQTRNYIQHVVQGESGEHLLPDGPIIMSPDRLIASFKREVIYRKPQVFKIAALRDIRNLFPDAPFYAGFGNRDTDAIAYAAVGIPAGKIFIINPQGEIKHVNRTYKKSYPKLNELVHEMFPALPEESNTAEPLSPHQDSRSENRQSAHHRHSSSAASSVSEEYNAYNYWRASLVIDEADLDFV